MLARVVFVLCCLVCAVVIATPTSSDVWVGHTSSHQSPEELVKKPTGLLDQLAALDFLNNMWETIWNYLLDNYSHFTLFTFGISFFAGVTYWVCGLVYLWFDFMPAGSWPHRYKIQDGKNLPPNKEQLKKLLWVVTRNQVVQIVFCGLGQPAVEYLNPSLYDRELPTVWGHLLNIVICALAYELGFFTFHYISHQGILYQKIHKIHHEYQAPIGLAATYCHWLEHIVCNMTPFLMGAVASSYVHLTSFYLFVIIALFATVTSHSGYHFPFLPSPEFHDYHHLKFNQNFGMIGIMDAIFGTRHRWNISYQRHLHMVYFWFDYSSWKQSWIEKCKATKKKA